MKNGKRPQLVNHAKHFKFNKLFPDPTWLKIIHFVKKKLLLAKENLNLGGKFCFKLGRA